MTATTTSNWAQRIQSPWGQALLVGMLIFAASLFGILTRPVGFLAAFWPANALLLGLMVRFPSMATARGWIAATIGYLAADFLTGGGLLMTLWLTAGNLAGAATGVALFQQLTEEDRFLRRPLSVLSLLAICAATGAAAALVGGGAGPVLIGKSWWTSCGFWFVTELVNGMLLLPVILTSPAPSEIRSACAQGIARVRREPLAAIPLLMLLISMIFSILLGGVGAIMFSIPALLWCALTYDLFFTSIFTLMYCGWMLIAVSSGALVLHPHIDYINEMMSIRLGISLLVLGPLTAASINQTREQLVQSLNYAANHDYLTNAIARRAFMRLGTALMTQKSEFPADEERRQSSVDPQSGLAVLMMDIDHFKRVNDQHGHGVGDQVLIAFTETISRSLRDGDLLGRLGGEEFAVILQHVAFQDAQTIAERLRAGVEATPVEVAEGETLLITVSIGLAFAEQPTMASLGSLLSEADQALYQSKQAGRNRVTSVYSADQPTV